MLLIGVCLMMTNKIINFMHMEDMFQDTTIDEITHEEDLLNFSVIHNECSVEDSFNLVNSTPKYVVKLEKFYDLHDKFKGVVNYKTNSSSMQYETINLGTESNPQNINLGLDAPKRKGHLSSNCSKNTRMYSLGHMMI
jgi:hypothetical protein